MKLLLILFSGLLMNACGCHKKVNTTDMENKITASTQNEKLSGVYTIQLLSEATVDSDKLILNFDSENKTVSGFSGCNNFSGSYKEINDNIEFENLIATEKYCNEDSKIESVFLAALSNTKTYQLKDGVLSFHSKKGNVLTAQSVKEKRTIQEPKKVLTYGESTRGYFFEAVLLENKLLVKEERGQVKPKVIAVANSDMEIIQTLIAKINLKTISTLESPTKKRHFDGATHASIVIFQKEESYGSSAFDGGAPPEELKALVNKVIALTKPEKQ